MWYLSEKMRVPISVRKGSIGSSSPEEREDGIDEEVRGTAADEEDSDWRHCCRKK
jgi:hypothetical protein